MQGAVLALCLWLSAPQAPEQVPAADGVARARVCVEAWIGASAGDDAARCAAARAIAAARRPAVQELAQRLAATRAATDHAERERLLALVPAVGIEVWRRELATGFYHFDQYAELRELLPEIGTYFAGLVTEPPSGMSPEDRVQAVRVLRDLHAEPPDPAVRAHLRAAAGEEPADLALQRAIACALAQWGERDLAERHRRDLRAQATRGSLEDRFTAQQELAQLTYQLRDFGGAADVQLEYLHAAEAAHRTVLPFACYNAACFLCLAGRDAEALQCLERCLDLQPATRPSLRVKRLLFEQDPELAAIRNTDRFRELLRKAARN